jgi:hypothetical protein
VRPRACPRLEALERRDLLAVSLLGDPTWVATGPAPITSGDVRLDPTNNNFTRLGAAGDIVSGAIEAVAVYPNNPRVLLAGAAGGGIWRSTDSGAHWTAETDQFASLAITDIAYSRLNYNVVYASTGNVSASYPGDPTLFSTQASGVLKSTDGGVTWAQLGAPTNSAGQPVRLTRVVPTQSGDPITGDKILLAAAMDGGGIYRSTDGGMNWTSVLDGDPAGNTPKFFNFANFGADLVGDPDVLGRFFAAIPGSNDPTNPGGGGIYRSDDYGATWTNIAPASSDIAGDVQRSGRVLLALSRQSGTPNYALYSEVITAGHLTNLYRTTDAGSSNAPNWAAVANAQDPFPAGQGYVDGAILAASTSVVYVSGDAYQTFPFTGVLYKVDATAGTWTPLSLSMVSAPTRLAAAVDGTSTKLNVAAASAVPVSSVIQVDNELMTVTARDTRANTLTVTRAPNATKHEIQSPVIVTTTLAVNLTTLAADVPNAPEGSSTTLTVSNAAAVPNLSVIQIDSEQMGVTAVNPANKTLTVVRGVNNTSPSAHSASVNNNPNPVILSFVTASGTTLPVRNAAAIPNGSIIQIDSELMQVTAVDTANNTLTVVRGVNGTSASARFALVNNNPNPVILITNGANNTGPHADSRVLAFSTTGNLLEGDDGGLFELTGLGTTTPTWVSRNGDPNATNPSPLQTTQFNSAALDPVHNSIIGGAQDQATEFQVNGTNGSLTWNGIQPSGDGQLAAVDSAGDWHYESTQNLGFFERFQFTTDGQGNNTLGTAATTLAAAADAGKTTLSVANASTILPNSFIRIDSEVLFVSAVDPANKTLTVSRGRFNTAPAPHDARATVTFLTHLLQLTTKQGDDPLPAGNALPFNTRWALNAAASAQADLVLGTNLLWESTDRGDNLTELKDANGNPVMLRGNVSAIAYGGVSGGKDNPGVLYVGTNAGQLLLRTTGVGTGTFNDIAPRSDSGAPLLTAVQTIALDLTNWSIAVVVTQRAVWLTPNAGFTWFNITEGLNDPDLLSAQVLTVNGKTVFLVGGSGGLYRNLGDRKGWTQYGQNLPNVPIAEVHYYGAANGTLLVATYGRGTWELTNANATLATAGELDVNGNTTVLRLDPNNKLLLDVFVDKGSNPTGTPDQVLKLSSISNIVVTGVGANAAMVIDTSNGPITLSGGPPRFVGNGNNSQVGFRGQTFSRPEALSAAPFGNGTVTVDDTTVDYSNTQALDDLNAAPALVFNAPAADQQINVVDGQSIDGAPVTQINSGASQTFLAVNFANKAAVTVDAAGGSDTFTLNNPDPAAGLTSLQVNGSDQANSFLVQSTAAAAPLTILSGAGNNSFYLSSAVGSGGTLDGLRGPLAIDAGAGSNFLTVSDAGGSSPDTITLTDGSITDTALGLGIAYGGRFAGVNLATGPGAVRVNVQSTAAGAVTGVLNLGGSDTIDVCSNTATNLGDLSGLKGTLLVEALGGTNLLVASEAGRQTRDDVVVTAGALGSRDGAGFTIDYAAAAGGAFSGINFASGSGDDHITVQGAPAGTPVALYKMGGNDDVNVGVSPDSGCDLTVDSRPLGGGASTAVLGVADESGTATIDNVPSGLDSGVVEVLYTGKKPSTITYLGVEGVSTDPAAG